MTTRSIVTALVMAVLLVPGGPASAQQAKCLAGKTTCLAKKATGLLKCEALAETPKKPADPNAKDCVTKVQTKFDGGSDPTKGCFEKLESKSPNDCLTFDDTAAAERAVDACVASLVAAIDPPPIDQTKCGAAKKQCVSKYLAALLKCRRVAQTPKKPTDPNTKGCVDNATAKYTGGTDPNKGCFAKLEAKKGNDCQAPLGNSVTLQADVENCVTNLVDLETGTTTTTTTSTTTSTLPRILQAIAVTPANPTVPVGLTQQFAATGTFSDSSTQDLTVLVTWASSDTSKATVSNTPGSQGLATAIGAGTPAISATLGGVSGSTTLTVTAAVLQSIAVTPANPSVPAGLTQQFTATGTFSDLTVHDLTAQVTWASSDTSKATVSNAAGSQGVATAIGTGTTAISAKLGEVSGSTTLTVTAAVLQSIAVTPPNPSVPAGRTQQFTATGTFSDLTAQDLTAQVTWASSNPARATISNAAGSQGLASTLQAGTTTISAQVGGILGSTTLTVTP